MEKIKVELTAKQAGLVLGALRNESSDDAAEFGEYSYWRCYRDLVKKFKKAGFENSLMFDDGLVEEES